MSGECKYICRGKVKIKGINHGRKIPCELECVLNATPDAQISDTQCPEFKDNGGAIIGFAKWERL